MHNEESFGMVNVADFLRQVYEGVISKVTQSPSELRKREISSKLAIGNVLVPFFGI